MQHQTTASTQTPAYVGATQPDADNQVLTISFTKFRELFKPKANHFMPDGAWFGTAIAYFSEVSNAQLKEQYEFVQTVQKAHPLKVWTIIDAESIAEIVAVNRFVGLHQGGLSMPLGYILTEADYDPTRGISVNIFDEDR